MTTFSAAVALSRTTSNISVSQRTASRTAGTTTPATPRPNDSTAGTAVPVMNETAVSIAPTRWRPSQSAAESKAGISVSVTNDATRARIGSAFDEIALPSAWNRSRTSPSARRSGSERSAMSASVPPSSPATASSAPNGVRASDAVRARICITSTAPFAASTAPMPVATPSSPRRRTVQAPSENSTVFTAPVTASTKSPRIGLTFS